MFIQRIFGSNWCYFSGFNAIHINGHFYLCSSTGYLAYHKIHYGTAEINMTRTWRLP